MFDALKVIGGVWLAMVLTYGLITAVLMIVCWPFDRRRKKKAAN